MSVRSFIRESGAVAIGERRYSVRAPTVATVQLLFDLMAPELALMTALHEANGLTKDKAVALFAASEHADRILSTCVDGIGDGDEDSGELEMLAIASLDMMEDLPRILREFTRKTKAQVMEQMTLDLPTDQEIGIVRVAQAFGLTPFDVMDWPYEGFVAVTEVLALDPEAHERLKDFSPEFLRAVKEFASARN